MQIHVRKLIACTSEQLWDLLKDTGNWLIEFDNGVVEDVSWKHVVYSTYAWDFFRTYPNVTIEPKHFLKHILKGKGVTGKTHRKLLGAVMWSVYDANVATCGMAPLDFRDVLGRTIYQKANEMYCEFIKRLGKYVTSTDLLDYVELLRHPKILSIKRNLKNNVKSLSEGANRVVEVVQHDPGLSHNNVAVSLHTENANAGQVQQCIGPRGPVTDINSQQFPRGIYRGYAEGLLSMHDSSIESRSAAKALISSGILLPNAEYFSRRLQLVDETVQRLHHEDCGSTEYVHWPVTTLRPIIGKHYMDATETLRTVSMEDAGLIGTTIRMRSTTKCRHPDENGICAVCFGAFSESVTRYANIGNMCATEMTKQTGQSILSTKHHDVNSMIAPIVLDSLQKKFFKVGHDRSQYMFSESMRTKQVTMAIKPSQASNITDIYNYSSVHDLNLASVSMIDAVEFTVTTKNGSVVESVPIKAEHRLPSMSYALLNYVKEHGWSLNQEGNIVIDLADWDYSGNNSAFALPLKQFTMSDHAKDIATMIESTMKQVAERDKEISPDSFLIEFCSLVNDKLNVNLAVIEVIVLATMIRSAEKHDYRIPKDDVNRGLGVMRSIMEMRSLGPAMGFQGQFTSHFINPLSYLVTKRPDHPMDALLVPREYAMYNSR